MLNANMHKYDQNPELNKRLQATGNKKRREVSKDMTWATGKSMWDQTAFQSWPQKRMKLST